METTIHAVDKIEFGNIDGSSTVEGKKYYTRRICIETERREKYTITCFANKREGLQIEVEEIRKV